MGSSEALFRATLHRISARLGHGLADAAAELAVLAQDAPDRLRQEWELFQEEVRAEAERLEHPEQAGSPDSDQAADVSAQERIDRLRAMVATISRELEEKA
ncbi:hypothetical protein [Parasynechococcus sp.]|jgi:hypothetical protein|uniref:hypothetical protein n=1 Tax=Parasynechococcus sp. TaxID=3101203 RepID=UPI0037047A2F